ncbi:MAG: radical SAM protein [Bacteriovoracaceae bacterium]|jgi:MoaA/NifB/PqqE/SkfB family radical SAM enzyme|nr:radical SAM protein [Bacteriovoracaceae bacterium]
MKKNFISSWLCFDFLGVGHQLVLLLGMINNLIRKLAARKIINSKVEDLGRSLLSKVFYKLGAQLTHDLEFPFQINLELSRACNYDCPFCARTETVVGSHIKFDLAKSVIDEATSLNKPTLFALHMWGEPMLNPEWGRIISYIKKQKVQHRTSLTTNGFLLDTTNIEALLQSKLDQVIISLHTFDPAEYQIRIGKNIDLFFIENNIKNLLAAIQSQNSKTKVLIRLFLDAKMQEEQSHKIKEYEDLGAVFEFDYYDNSAGDRQEWSEIPFTKQNKRWACYHPWLTATVNIFGEVTICCVDSKMALQVGDANHQKISEIWKNDKVKKIRNEHRTGKFSPTCEVCKGCDTWANKPDMFFGSP